VTFRSTGATQAQHEDASEASVVRASLLLTLVVVSGFGRTREAGVATSANGLDEK
jgi:hypothetical protein